jgi:hypothetical protein
MTATDVSIGDRDIALANEILRTTVGSGVHGMAIEGHDDNDEMGVYVETPEQVMALEPTAEHYVSRTQPEGVRSGPGDTDLTLYALRKYMRLATAGNPTVLTVLYAPDSAILYSDRLGRSLRAVRHLIVSMRAGRRHLGYLDGQRERMVGGGNQARVPNRPELIEAYGYDTKYASHALRLGLQGIELVTTGHLSLPLRPADLSLCMEIKTGKVTFPEALALVDDTRESLARWIDSGQSPLPPEPDMASVNAWMVKAHRDHWSGRQ